MCECGRMLCSLHAWNGACLPDHKHCNPIQPLALDCSKYGPPRSPPRLAVVAAAVLLPNLQQGDAAACSAPRRGRQRGGPSGAHLVGKAVVACRAVALRRDQPQRLVRGRAGPGVGDEAALLHLDLAGVWRSQRHKRARRWRWAGRRRYRLAADRCRQPSGVPALWPCHYPHRWQVGAARKRSKTAAARRCAAGERQAVRGRHHKHMFTDSNRTSQRGQARSVRNAK